MDKKSIIFRTTLYILLMTTAVLCLFGFYNYQSNSRLLYAQLDKYTQDLIGRLNISLPAAMWNFDTEQTVKIIEADAKAEMIHAIYIVDISGEITGRQKTEQGFVNRETIDPDFKGIVKRKEILFDDNGTINKVGELVLHIDNSPLKAQLKMYATAMLTQTLILDAVLMMVIMLIMRKIVITPLQKISFAMQDIAMGEGDLTARLDLDKNESKELSVLADAFNQFVKKIQISIGDVSNTSKIILEEVDQLEKIVCSNEESLEKLRQAKDKTVVEITEMSTTALQVARHTVNTAKETDHANEEVALASNVLMSTVETANSLVNEIENAANIIKNLEQEANNISSVTSVIRGISEQTNLLALNAAIEAARAGEKGRGFAVVASEVRDLASSTQQNTQQIHDMIERLQDGAKKAVSAMKHSIDGSRNSVDSSQATKHHLDTVVGHVSIINDMNTQIVSAAEEQSLVSEQINKSIEQISDIIERSAEDIHTTTAAGEKLALHGKRLRELVEQFKY